MSIYIYIYYVIFQPVKNYIFYYDYIIKDNMDKKKEKIMIFISFFFPYFSYSYIIIKIINNKYFIIFIIYYFNYNN